jgi:uncharacterized protein (DUF1501 family)
MSNNQFSRRNFLQSMLAAAGTATTPFALNLAALGTAAAQNANDYKALICLYMAGGNDGFNTVLATDSASWNEYNRLRSTGDAVSIALPGVGASGGVLPITLKTPQGGRTFALHPKLGSVKGLFDSGRAAIVANVGTLIQPTTKAQYLAGSVALPPKLFSHNDQQAVWQSNAPEGGGLGWGGRMGDLLASSNSSATFTCISAGGNAVFLTGKQIRQFQISTSGLPPMTNLNTSLFGAPAASNPLRSVLTAQGSSKFQNETGKINSRAIDSQAALSAAMAPSGAGGVPAPTPYISQRTGAATTNQLALQLQTVARIIAGRGALGVKRQVFYVNLGGFDTHDGQKLQQADLMARLDHAVAYFDSVMATLMGTDMRKQVTLFTASDFGRTFVTNGDGTDHGWGSHHFVFGGAVNGQNMYGSYPVTGINHDLDIGSGALLPTTSVDQYGATLASWFGVPDSQMSTIFPNIGNFTTRNLGFMAAA